MFKNALKFEFTVGEKIYHFICDNDSPLEHVKEAIFQMSKAIGQIEDNIKAQQAEQAKLMAETKIEPIPEQKAE